LNPDWVDYWRTELGQTLPAGELISMRRGKRALHNERLRKQVGGYDYGYRCEWPVVYLPSDPGELLQYSVKLELLTGGNGFHHE
jgi:hypothetical protein